MHVSVYIANIFFLFVCSLSKHCTFIERIQIVIGRYAQTHVFFDFTCTTKRSGGKAQTFSSWCNCKLIVVNCKGILKLSWATWQWDEEKGKTLHRILEIDWNKRTIHTRDFSSPCGVQSPCGVGRAFWWGDKLIQSGEVKPGWGGHTWVMMAFMAGVRSKPQRGKDHLHTGWVETLCEYLNKAI